MLKLLSYEDNSELPLDHVDLRILCFQDVLRSDSETLGFTSLFAIL